MVIVTVHCLFFFWNQYLPKVLALIFRPGALLKVLPKVWPHLKTSSYITSAVPMEISYAVREIDQSSRFFTFEELSVALMIYPNKYVSLNEFFSCHLYWIFWITGKYCSIEQYRSCDAYCYCVYFLWTHIILQGGLHQISWFQFLPHESDVNSLVDKRFAIWAV